MLSALHAQHVPATLLLPRDSMQLVRVCLQDAKLLDSLFSALVREPRLGHQATGLHHSCIGCVTTLDSQPQSQHVLFIVCSQQWPASW